MLVTKQLTVANDKKKNTMEVNDYVNIWLPTFFQISSFVFNPSRHTMS